MTVMMALGEYRFSLSTAAYNELKRVSEWRWAAPASAPKAN